MNFEGSASLYFAVWFLRPHYSWRFVTFSTSSGSRSQSIPSKAEWGETWGQVLFCAFHDSRHESITRALKPPAACCGAQQSTGEPTFPYSELDLEGGARDPALPNDCL